MNNEQKRTFLAFALSAVVLFSWQYFYGEKPEDKAQENTQEQVVSNTALNESSEVASNTVQNNNLPSTTNEQATNDAVLKEAKVSTFQFENLELTLDQYLNIYNLKSPNSVYEFNEVFTQNSQSAAQILFLINNQYRPVAFTLTQESSTVVKASNENIGINLFISLNKNRLIFSIQSKNPIFFRIKFNATEEGSNNYNLKQFVFLKKEVDRFDVGDEEKEMGKFKYVGVDFSHHLFAFIFKDKLLGNLQSNETSVNLTSSSQVNEISFDILFAKKNYDFLVSEGDSLDLFVNFGMFSVIAVPILKSLQFLYTYIPNYGIGIIILTILIRLITYPLQFKSFKSMKKMQKIQPELAKLREKFKDEPQKMQMESMKLFKKAGANPLSGCLPMILQMPIFFAFYKVLSVSVELVGAPFAFWITDLSHKDPYYVLPVLMAITMFLQQKLTPSTTADPNQKKILMFMPLIFGFIMKDLPSGLTLYIFVSTLMGIIQQTIVNKVVD